MFNVKYHDITKVSLINQYWVLGFKDTFRIGTEQTGTSVILIQKGVIHLTLGSGIPIAILLNSNGASLSVKSREVIVGKSDLSDEISSLLRRIGIETEMLSEG